MKGENGCRNYFMTKLHERILLDVKIELYAYQADVHSIELPRPDTKIIFFY